MVVHSWVGSILKILIFALFKSIRVVVRRVRIIRGLEILSMSKFG